MTSPIATPRGYMVQDRRKRLVDRDWFPIVVGAVLAILVGILTLGEPSTVDLEIQNPTEFDISARVGSGDGNGAVLLTTIEAGSTRRVENVIDQGETWIFEFSGQARDGGELAIPRAQLTAADWKLEIPPEVAESLRGRGAAPSDN